MYIGLDFLLAQNGDLFLSEVNTGLPGGAQEYDFVYRQKYGRSSGIFEKIESISYAKYKKSFSSYLNGLPFMDGLKRLKLWMDGASSLPKSFHPQFRLEDKWVQYLLLSVDYPMVYTCLLSPNIKKIYEKQARSVLKKRYGRGGKGFMVIDRIEEIEGDIRSFICQPYIDSSIETSNGHLRLSIRAASFSGEFICMFANLSAKMTSNHGIRTYISKGQKLGLKDKSFNKRKIIKKAWEADIIFGDKIPPHLYDNLYKEVVSDTELMIPKKTYDDIADYAKRISLLYDNLDFEKLPICYLEDAYYQ